MAGGAFGGAEEPFEGLGAGGAGEVAEGVVGLAGEDLDARAVVELDADGAQAAELGAAVGDVGGQGAAVGDADAEAVDAVADGVDLEVFEADAGVLGGVVEGELVGGGAAFLEVVHGHAGGFAEDASADFEAAELGVLEGLPGDEDRSSRVPGRFNWSA